MLFDDFYLRIEKELPSLTIDEIKDRLTAYQPHYTPRLIHIPAHSSILRVRKYDETLSLYDPVSIKQLSYPASGNAVKKGRVNRSQEPVFYGALRLTPAIFEVENLTGHDNLILSIWRTSSDLSLCSAGYTRSTNLEDVPHISLHEPFHLYRPSPDTNNLSPYNMSDWIHSAFVRTVPESKDYLYNLSIALGEMHLASTSHSCDGIVYPSAQVWPAGDNVALLPNVVDRCLAFHKAYQLHVTQLDLNHIELEPMACAIQANADGHLVWSHDYGHVKHVA